MTKDKLILILAIAILLTGIGALWRSLTPSGMPPPEHDILRNDSDNPSALSQYLLDDSLLVSPTVETVEANVQQAREAAYSTLIKEQSNPLQSARAEQLADRFAERLLRHLDPDFDKSAQSITSLGGHLPFNERSDKYDQFVQAWMRQSLVMKLAPIAPSDIHVRVRYVGGRMMEKPPRRANLTMRIPTLFELPNDAQKGKLDVYEVLIPVKLPTVNQDDPLGPRGERATMLMGYGFAWSNDQQDWLPWRLWIYSDQNPIGPNFY